MVKAKTPKDEWKALYEAATSFKELASWEWMEEEDIFAIEDPEEGEMGYCVVIGSLGETFGLIVYLGNEGLKGYFQLLDGHDLPCGIDSFHSQKCLLVSFVDRNQLQKDDRQLIKELGLTFRGRNQWPIFRQYTPGFHPWFLQANDVRFLTHALEQAREVSIRFRDDPDFFLQGDNGEEILVRIPITKGEEIQWKDSWIIPDLEVKVEGPPLNELQLYRAKNKALHSDTIWIADVFFSPSAVLEEKGDRPYYPPVFLLIDGGSGIIMNCQLFQHDTYISKARDSFLSTIESTRIIPHLLLLEREEVVTIFEPLAQKLGISIHVERDLEILEEVKEGLFDMFS